MNLLAKEHVKENDTFSKAAEDDFNFLRPEGNFTATMKMAGHV